MQRYTTQVEISFGKLQEWRAIVPDEGASVTVETWSGAGWVGIQNSPLTAPGQLYTSFMRYRFTPADGGFAIDEDNAS